MNQLARTKRSTIFFGLLSLKAWACGSTRSRRRMYIRIFGLGEQCFERQLFKRIVPELISQGCVLGGMPRVKLGRWAAGGKEKRRSSDAHDAANRLPTLGTLLLRLVRNRLVLPP